MIIRGHSGACVAPPRDIRGQSYFLGSVFTLCPIDYWHAGVAGGLPPSAGGVRAVHLALDERSRRLLSGGSVLFITESRAPLCPQVPEWALDHWHPSEKAQYPDYFSKREQWKQLRMQSWDQEVRPHLLFLLLFLLTHAHDTHRYTRILVVTFLRLKKPLRNRKKEIYFISPQGEISSLHLTHP